MVSRNRNCPTLADFFSASVFNAVFAFASLHGPIPQLGTPPGDFAFAGYRYLVERRRFTGAFAEPAAHHEPLVFQIVKGQANVHELEILRPVPDHFHNGPDIDLAAAAEHIDRRQNVRVAFLYRPSARGVRV